MKFFLSVFLFISSFQLEKAFAQEVNPEIVGKTMNDFKNLEKKLKGKVYEVDGDVVIPTGMEMPIMYRRAQKSIPDLIVTYTFAQKDSLIYQIKYSWDPRNFEKGDPSKKSLEFDKLLIKKYNELLAMLTAKYGTSKSKGELTDLQKIESNSGLSRSDTWVTNDKIEVYMTITMSNNYRFRETGSGLPLHILNVYVNHQRK